MPRSKARPIIPCEDCGTPIRRKPNPAIPQLCIQCGVRHSIENVQQLRAKKGPYYERWLVATGRGSTARPNSGGK